MLIGPWWWLSSWSSPTKLLPCFSRRRFLHYHQNHNHNHNGWSSMTMSSIDFLDGSDDDGFDAIDPDVIAAAFKEENKRRKLSLSPLASGPAAAAAARYDDDDSLQRGLLEHFGYSKFREAQLDAIRAVLEHKRDVAVFWATGQGKSLIYQLPALMQKDATAIVVSPLISLMQDQVAKINVLAGGATVATYLGSAQTDATLEARLHQFRLVYVTPEKLVTMVDRLAELNVSLIAMDEAHCVSEWGFDFRPEFRQVGDAVRSHPVLSKVPLIGLTATATPRVRTDILESLGLRNPFVSQLSLDRTNLQIQVYRKKGIPDAMKEFLALSSTSQVSTIIYAPTRASVESIHQYLVSHGVPCEAYHAGLADRAKAHTNFLTGQTTVLVATTAFGMGIDKPDIRKIIHYGPPKTVEEYYQQIGRAGRDGLPARCVLYTNDSDFDAYMSDFYIGKLVGNARKAVLDSLQALRNYAASADRCRRQEVLHYFGQPVAPCGICDVCQTIKTHGSLTRDFGGVVRVLLDAITSLDQPSASNLLKVATGGVLAHEHQYSRQSGGPLVVQNRIQRRRESIKGNFTQATYKELLGLLKEKGYVSSSIASANVNGFSRTWSVHALTVKGSQALLDESSPIILPVPQGIREAEQIKEERFQKQLTYLDQKGIPKSRIPQEEIDLGDGPVLQAYHKWHSYLEVQVKNQKPTDHLEQLVRIIESWRSDTAVALRLAPVSVLAEHLVVSIAYVTATSIIAIDEMTLATIGVRVKERLLLAAQLAVWHVANGPKSLVSATSHRAPAGVGAQTMVLGEISPSKPWQHAVYKKVKKTGMAAWEASYMRFTNGESPQAIAMSQPGGKPIQAATVVSHILDALTHGRRIADASMLGQFCTPPTRLQWERLQEAEAVTKIDVCGSPSTFTMTELLRPVVGDALVDTPFANRSDEQKAQLKIWYDALKWYMVLRRSDTVPVFVDVK